MSYCYCTPSRSLLRAVPAGTTPEEAGISHLSHHVIMGSKGYWVYRAGRANALKGWETRRRLQAEAHARLQETHAEVTPMVVTGTITTSTEVQPIALKV